MKAFVYLSEGEYGSTYPKLGNNYVFDYAGLAKIVVTQASKETIQKLDRKTPPPRSGVEYSDRHGWLEIPDEVYSKYVLWKLKGEER